VFPCNVITGYIRKQVTPYIILLWKKQAPWVVGVCHKRALLWRGAQSMPPPRGMSHARLHMSGTRTTGMSNILAFQSGPCLFFTILRQGIRIHFCMLLSRAASLNAKNEFQAPFLVLNTARFPMLVMIAESVHSAWIMPLFALELCNLIHETSKLSIRAFDAVCCS
jgi:hypothetical protein